MKRYLMWHFPPGSFKEGQSFYLDADSKPVAVRIHADTAPNVSDATFDIYDDGVSIFNDKNVDVHDAYGRVTPTGTNTNVFLAKSSTSEDAAHDFVDAEIEEGSWVTCTMTGNGGGGKNFSIQLELVSEDIDSESEEAG